MSDVNGVLSIHKPPGLSSADVIRIFKRRNSFKGKIGHAGTLDVFASGVLIILLGKGTKRFDEFQTYPKTYEAVVRLGYSSPTLDVEGVLTAVENAPEPSKDEVLAVLPSFLGEQQQTVPSYSAAKHKGRPLYDWARSGTELTKTKQVTIHALELVAYRYPLLTIRVTCGSGTYIRQLGADIAEKLGTKGFLSSLERTAVGPYDLSKCLSLERIEDYGKHTQLA